MYKTKWKSKLMQEPAKSICKKDSTKAVTLALAKRDIEEFLNTFEYIPPVPELWDDSYYYETSDHIGIRQKSGEIWIPMDEYMESVKGFYRGKAPKDTQLDINIYAGWVEGNFDADLIERRVQSYIKNLNNIITEHVERRSSLYLSVGELSSFDVYDRRKYKNYLLGSKTLKVKTSPKAATFVVGKREFKLPHDTPWNFFLV